MSDDRVIVFLVARAIARVGGTVTRPHLKACVFGYYCLSACGPFPHGRGLLLSHRSSMLMSVKLLTAPRTNSALAISQGGRRTGGGARP